MRRQVYAANWKLQKTQKETRDFFDKFIPEVQFRDDIDVIIAPPYTSLNAANEATRDYHIKIAAQNMYYEKSGAFTGEISAEMILETGAETVILGHSERRHVFGESDQIINKKIKQAFVEGLLPIFCIGELIEDREAGKTFDILEKQLKLGLNDIDNSYLQDIIVAYEPVWAIGTGKTATPEIAEEAHEFVRKTLSEIINADVAAEIRILYGGSVKPANIVDLMSQEDIDGVLVGGASLDPDSFAAIINH